MALSNAERQARYRERLKALAQRGELSPERLTILSRIRPLVRSWKRHIAVFDAGVIKPLGGAFDMGQLETTRRLIEQNELLIAELDPDGLSADGNIEMGDIGRELVGQLTPGLTVTFGLDEHRHAVGLKLYQEPHWAALEVAGTPDRHRGVIAEDYWSIIEEGADEALG